MPEILKETLKETFFTAYHLKAGARFVPFAGYNLPVSFLGGIAEHNHVRGGGAGLFDVSHMGQISISGPQAIAEFDHLVPSNIHDMAHNQAKYSVLMNAQGGIIDDCIITKNSDNSLFIVVNGSRKKIVLAHLNEMLQTAQITHHIDFGLLALQGAQAIDILKKYDTNIAQLSFMQSNFFILNSMKMRISRCGYTGEDGFEISVSKHHADAVYQLLTSSEAVQSIGLGARDTLRLEAGLSLYGQDITEETSPIEADLSWLISKRKTENKSYLGADIIAHQRKHGTSKIRVGLLPQTKAPMRQGVKLFNQQDQEIGVITSGTFSPTLQRPIAMGYVDPAYSQVKTEIFAELRGKKIAVHIEKLPFIMHKYCK